MHQEKYKFTYKKMILTEKKKKKIERDEAIIREISEAIKDGGMKSAIYIHIGKKYRVSPITAGTLYRNYIKSNNDYKQYNI